LLVVEVDASLHGERALFDRYAPQCRVAEHLPGLPEERFGGEGRFCGKCVPASSTP
jgi:hypothetical protein